MLAMRQLRHILGGEHRTFNVKIGVVVVIIAPSKISPGSMGRRLVICQSVTSLIVELMVISP